MQFFTQSTNNCLSEEQWQEVGGEKCRSDALAWILTRQTMYVLNSASMLLSIGVSYFLILQPLTDKLFSFPRGDLLWSMSPSGQMNYLSPPSISGVGIMRHGNQGLNTVAKTSPWIRGTVNHHRAHFRRCCHFSDSPDLYGAKAINDF